MDRVRDHTSYQFPSKLHEVFPGEKFTSALRYMSIAGLKKEPRFSLPCCVKAESPNPSIVQPSQASGHTATKTRDRNTNSRSRGGGSRKPSPKGNDRSVGQVMSVSDLFSVQFDYWTASEEVWPVVCAVSNQTLRALHPPPPLTWHLSGGPCVPFPSLVWSLLKLRRQWALSRDVSSEVPQLY